MKKLNIVYYSPHPTHDIVSEVGYATHQRETILALEKLGHTVIKVIMGGTQRSELKFEPGKAIEPTGLKAIIKKLVPRLIWITLKDIKLLQHDKRAVKILEKEILFHQPDLVYERSEILQSGSVRVVKKHKVPYFLEVNAPFVEEMKRIEGRSLLHFMAKSKEKVKLDAANAVFTVSTALVNYLQSEYGVEQKKLHLAPNRINIENFRQSKDLVETGVFTFGFVGSILPFHNVRLLIESFKEIANRNNNVKLLIVGEGRERSNLEQLSKALGIETKVEFVGSVPHIDVANYIRKMHVCIMPGTNWYGSPVKIFEYGAMCKPIIAPNKIPLRDVMENGIDGILVNETVAELSAAMQETLSNYAEAIKRAEFFYSKIMKKYCWQHAAQQIVNVYDAT